MHMSESTNDPNSREVSSDSSEQLTPTSPREAVDLYLEERKRDVAPETLQNHKYALGAFVDWCAQEGIASLDALDARTLHQFRHWRAEQLSRVSLQTQLVVVRTAIRLWEKLDICEDGLAEKMIIPQRPEVARDEKIDPDRVEQILDFLEKFHYASRDHALFLTLWHTGMRMGDAQSLDVGDVHRDGRMLELRHRRDEGTTLKNGLEGERCVALSDEATEVLGDYIDRNRIDVRDDHGRDPLFTTERGRIAKNTIRKTTYRLTRPCVYANHCPHDRDPDDCEAATYHGSGGCPSSHSPHPIRRGAITWLLLDGPSRAVSDRCDVSKEVIDTNYDRRTEQEKMEKRRDALDL